MESFWVQKVKRAENWCEMTAELFREFSLYANFITANFVTAVFQNHYQKFD